MIQKKVAMLGCVAVGKTSLTERFVESIFSDRYRTTVGVRIHRKEIALDGETVALVIWDLAGEDDLIELRTSYLRGTAGYVLVADGTRRETLARAVQLQLKVRADLGSIPFLLAVNKVDRAEDWTIDDADLSNLERDGWTIIRTSARTGAGVDALFEELAAKVASYVSRPSE
jgi:small GTP-binding protein